MDDDKRTLSRVAFSKSACGTCSARDQCTRTVKQHLTFPEQAVFERSEKRRTEQKEKAFHDKYRILPGIEGTMSEDTFVLGMRRVSYRRLDKTHLQHVLTATAMNLTRAMNWLTKPAKSKTRTTRLARLSRVTKYVYAAWFRPARRLRSSLVC
jgi:transposase